jgi:hypothetical protein
MPSKKTPRKSRARRQSASKRPPHRRRDLLQGARVYLSGPMDFVASRAAEQKFGWRNRVSEFLSRLGVTVFDPWFKPEVRGFHEYGLESEQSTEGRDRWTFRSGKEGAAARASCAELFWSTLHIDLRMVDTSDFLISYCPTNIYSVGTPHEIILARQQRKPVLLVSPAVDFPVLYRLREHLKAADDAKGLKLLEDLETEVPIKPNPLGIPSLWYMPLVAGENFFDSFGFRAYRNRFGWPTIPLDASEDHRPQRRPLLPFLEKLSRKLPRKWDRRLHDFVADDDWLLWDLKPLNKGGAKLRDV